MKIIRKRSMSEPRNPYGGSDKINRVTHLEPNHVPYNKLPHEVHDAQLQTHFIHCERNDVNDGWLEIHMCETVTPYTKDGNAGRTYTRDISVTLSREEIEKLVSLLNV